jgi:hypothetical protein
MEMRTSVEQLKRHTKVLERVDKLLEEHQIKLQSATGAIHPQAHQITKLYKSNPEFRSMVNQALDQIISDATPQDLLPK